MTQDNNAGEKKEQWEIDFDESLRRFCKRHDVEWNLVISGAIILNFAKRWIKRNRRKLNSITPTK